MMTMLSFSEIAQKAEEVAKAVETHAASIFHHGVADLAREVQDVESKAKAEALVLVQESTPEVKAAVEAAVEAMEKAILSALEARLA